jgi:hypothetical protein
MHSSPFFKAFVLIGLVLLAGAASTWAAAPDAGALPAAGLRLEYLSDPLGVDVRLPRFFWTPR